MQGIVALLLKCLPEYCLDEFLCPKLLVHFSGFPCPKCFVIFAHLKSFFCVALLSRYPYCTFFACPKKVPKKGRSSAISTSCRRWTLRHPCREPLFAAGGWSADLIMPTTCMFCSFCSPKKNPKGLRCRSTPFCASCTASTFENPFSARGLLCFHTFMPSGMCGILPTSPCFLRPSWPQSLLIVMNFFSISINVLLLLLNDTSNPVFFAAL